MASPGDGEDSPREGRERYDVLDVSFLFQHGDKTTPIRDPELAARLGIAVGDRVPLTDYAARLSQPGNG